VYVVCIIILFAGHSVDTKVCVHKFSSSRLSTPRGIENNAQPYYIRAQQQHLIYKMVYKSLLLGLFYNLAASTKASPTNKDLIGSLRTFKSETC